MEARSFNKILLVSCFFPGFLILFKLALLGNASGWAKMDYNGQYGWKVQAYSFMAYLNPAAHTGFMRSGRDQRSGEISF